MIVKKILTDKNIKNVGALYDNLEFILEYIERFKASKYNLYELVEKS